MNALYRLKMSIGFPKLLKPSRGTPRGGFAHLLGDLRNSLAEITAMQHRSEIRSRGIRSFVFPGLLENYMILRCTKVSVLL
jgi:hypothetical protein